MKEYRWGILGTGAIAHKFARGLKEIPEAVPYSVHSRTFDKALAFAESYNFKTTCKNLAPFLDDPDLDIVYIATPNHLHCEQAIRCMEAGKHVLVEKPIVLNVGQMNRIEKAAARTGRFCMEAMWMRFIPVYQQVQKILRAGELGQIKLFSAEFGEPIAYNPERFRFSLEKGGGSLMDLGVYPVSLALMLLGKPERVEGICRKAESGVDTLERFSFYYANGTIADLRSTFDCQLSNSVWIGGDKAAIEIPGPIYRPDRFNLRSRNATEETRVPYEGNGYQYEALEVMEVLERGDKESSIMSLEDSRDVLEITDRLRRKWGVEFPGIDNTTESP